MRRLAWRSGAGLAAILLSCGPLLAQHGIVSGVVHVAHTPSRGSVVYLIPRAGDPLLPDEDPVQLDQRNLHFVPNVLLVLPGQEIAFRNSDPLLHNVFSPDLQGEDFDLGTYPTGESRTHVFQRPGAHVILCHIHPEMVAYVFVASASHYAVADEEGRFEIDEVPPGQYILHAWHPRAGPFRRTIKLHSDSSLRLEINLERSHGRGRRGN